MGLFRCRFPVQKRTVNHGGAGVSTDGQNVDAQVRQLTKAGCRKAFRETASGAKRTARGSIACSPSSTPATC
jgi:hypothetical protein